jgi:hypothetical protein
MGTVQYAERNITVATNCNEWGIHDINVWIAALSE